ncbi:hypothetical protein BV898_02844 [Hypsibius exemplaris]|uniref:Uncharacterized protein n=1 Tax=Hypsibius exemplaris TaxID=2072580 RepID=A0A1W0X7L2_HYPEX|nr:hypothetical protein BV898_02844 [Hypsibius exemplaris]
MGICYLPAELIPQRELSADDRAEYEMGTMIFLRNTTVDGCLKKIVNNSNSRQTTRSLASFRIPSLVGCICCGNSCALSHCSRATLIIIFRSCDTKSCKVTKQ